VRRKVFKLICIFFFSLFSINVLIGKINIIFDSHIFYFGDVTEFLFLLISSISLTILALDMESMDKQKQKEKDNASVSNH
jgi:hypothetical protein